MGDYLTQLLTENYGYQVVHLKEQFDMAGGELDRSAAYDYARDYLEPYLQENPDIQVIIDLHRDGVPEDRHLVTEINGKPTAQILFYNGLSYTCLLYTSCARAYTISELEQAVKDFVDAEESVKTGRLEDKLSVELLIIKYSSKVK